MSLKSSAEGAALPPNTASR